MSLRIIGANLVVSVKSFYREKSVVFFRLAFPVILILVFGTIFMERDNGILELDVQDLDRTKSSAQLARTIELSGRFKISTIAPTLDAAQYARDNKRNLVLVVPKGYEESLTNRMRLDAPDASVTLTQIHDPSSFGVTAKMQVLTTVLAGIDQHMSGKPPFITSAEMSILSKEYRFIEFFVPGIIAMAVMTASLFGAVNANAELRQKGVIRKLSTTPVTRSDWLLSNILYQFVLALGKETYSDFNMDEMRRLTPVQNGSAALNIANVCRRFLDDD